jgi:hypothetical protein
MPKYIDQNKILYNIYEKNVQLGKAAILLAFQGLGLSRATAYRKLTLIESNGTLNRKVGSSRPRIKATKKVVGEIKKIVK